MRIALGLKPLCDKKLITARMEDCEKSQLMSEARLLASHLRVTGGKCYGRTAKRRCGNSSHPAK
jgi:hypothetical protein